MVLPPPPSPLPPKKGSFCFIWMREKLVKNWLKRSSWCSKSPGLIIFGNGSLSVLSIQCFHYIEGACNSCLRFEAGKKVVLVVIIFLKIILAIETSCLYSKDFYSTHLCHCIFNWVILTWTLIWKSCCFSVILFVCLYKLVFVVVVITILLLVSMRTYCREVMDDLDYDEESLSIIAWCPSPYEMFTHFLLLVSINCSCCYK